MVTAVSEIEKLWAGQISPHVLTRTNAVRSAFFTLKEQEATAAQSPKLEVVYAGAKALHPNWPIFPKGVVDGNR